MQYLYTDYLGAHQVPAVAARDEDRQEVTLPTWPKFQPARPLPPTGRARHGRPGQTAASLAITRLVSAYLTSHSLTVLSALPEPGLNDTGPPPPGQSRMMVPRPAALPPPRPAWRQPCRPSPWRTRAPSPG